MIDLLRQAADALQSELLAEAADELERYRAVIAEHGEVTRGLLPMQPIVLVDGIARFKENACVRFLLQNGGLTLNDLARQNFPREDQEQFAQLIGYSVCGFCSLSYVSEATAQRAVDALDDDDLPTGDAES